MIKKRLMWVLLFAALVMCGSAVYAQAPAGPEKAMIYKGDSLQVQLTGKLELDVVSNQYNMANETFPIYVLNQKVGLGADNFGYPGLPWFAAGSKAPWGVQFKLPDSFRRGALMFDTRYSQIGLTVTGAGFLGGTSFGRLEADFYGGFGTSAGNVSRQGVLRMRLAYAGLQWGDISKDMYNVKFTFGQYYALVCPLTTLPTTLNNLPFFSKGVLFDWDQGIMLSFMFGSPKVNVTIDVDMHRVKSATDSAGFVALGATSFGAAALYPGEGYGSGDNRGPGEAALHPGWAGKIGFNLNPSPVFAFNLAVQGHYQMQHSQVAHTNLALYGLPAWPAFIPDAQDIASKSLGAQANLNVWIFGLKGAGWIGQNMINFVAGFSGGVRESLRGTKNVADKGRAGYVEFNIQLPKVGIPIVLAVHAGQELKYNSHRIPYSSALGTTLTTTSYATTALNVLSNSEFSGTFMWFINQYLLTAYEFGQMDTKYKGVKGSSASLFHRLTFRYIF